MIALRFRSSCLLEQFDLVAQTLQSGIQARVAGDSSGVFGFSGQTFLRGGEPALQVADLRVLLDHPRHVVVRHERGGRLMQSIRPLDPDHRLQLQLLRLNLTKVFPHGRAKFDRILLLQDKCLPVVRPSSLRERSESVAKPFHLRVLRSAYLLERLFLLYSTLQVAVGHFLDVRVRDGIDQACQFRRVLALERDLQDLGSLKELSLQILREPGGWPRLLPHYLELVDSALLERLLMTNRLLIWINWLFWKRR